MIRTPFANFASTRMNQSNDSSVGKSTRLLSGWPLVRVQFVAPFLLVLLISGDERAIVPEPEVSLKRLVSEFLEPIVWEEHFAVTTKAPQLHPALPLKDDWPGNTCLFADDTAEDWTLRWLIANRLKAVAPRPWEFIYRCATQSRKTNISNNRLKQVMTNTYLSTFISRFTACVTDEPSTVTKFANLALRVINQAKLAESSIHGVAHWIAVMNNATNIFNELSAEFGGWKAQQLRYTHGIALLFGLFHDCMRENEDSDRGHGERAAMVIDDEYFTELIDCGFTPSALLAVIKACAYHDYVMDIFDWPTGISDKMMNLYMGVCLDADRLELPRVGVEIDFDYLHTGVAKKIAAEQQAGH